MKTMDFKVVLEPDPDGGYVVTCPTLPGCYSQRGSVDEALENIREAIELCIAEEDWNTIQETLYLWAIPGMCASIRRGLKTPISKCSRDLKW